MTATSDRPGTRAGRDGFWRSLRAEWIKFRTVRGWVIAVVVAVLAVVILGVGPSMTGTCGKHGPGSDCIQLLGPGGEAVTDSFYFMHQPLRGNGGITARVTALTGQSPASGRRGRQMRPGLMPWAKAGIIIKASVRQGSAYAAMMVTGRHGVRMQYDYTGDVPGIAGAVSATSPRWLRLARSGDTLTGYDSADGTHWTKVGSVQLAGLPAAVQGGLFVASPVYSQTSVILTSVSGGASYATGIFDHLSLRGAWPGGMRTGAWAGRAIGPPEGPAASSPGGYQQAGARFTVTGTGDIAPAVSGPSGNGVTITQTLIGLFVGLIVVVILGAMFMTAEYRRGLIRVTFAATPRRGRVLAAKAVVIGAVAFLAGLVASGVVVIQGQRTLRDNGVYVWPATALTEARVIVGTAAVLAVVAVIAVAIGAVLRSGAGAVATVVTVLVLPYLLTVVVPILPIGPTNWLARVTPIAAFAVQQTLIQYPQVSNIYAPPYGYFPLAPWAGFAVLCIWAAAALGLAFFLLRRRDA